MKKTLSKDRPSTTDKMVVVEEKPNIPANLKAGPKVVALANAFFHELRRAHTRLALPISISSHGVLGTVSDDGILSQLWAEFELRKCPLGLDFDAIAVTQWVKSISRKYAQYMFVAKKGRIGDVTLTQEAFVNSVNADVTSLCESLYEMASTIQKYSYTSDRKHSASEYLKFIKVNGLHASLVPDFETVLRDSMTVYATPQQAGYLTQLIPILDKLNALEKEFQASGLTLQGVYLNGSGYQFDREALGRIRG